MAINVYEFTQNRQAVVYKAPLMDVFWFEKDQALFLNNVETKGVCQFTSFINYKISPLDILQRLCRFLVFHVTHTYNTKSIAFQSKIYQCWCLPFPLGIKQELAWKVTIRIQTCILG